MATQEAADAKTMLMRRLCLRLDNGSRIGACPSLGVRTDGHAVRLDFTDGFKQGLVSEEDLNRISEIAGQLAARQDGPVAATPAAKPKAEPKSAPKEQKRQRVHKPPTDVSDAWTPKAAKVLDALGKHKFVRWFREPVRPTSTFAPDYLTVVQHPMDLGTVRDKLKTGAYASSAAFEADLNLIWSNAVLYNGSNSEVGKAALDLKKLSDSAMAKNGLRGTAHTAGPAASAAAVAPDPDVVVSERQTKRNRHAPEKWDPDQADPSDSKKPTSRPGKGRAQPSGKAARVQRDQLEATSGHVRGSYSSDQRDQLGNLIEEGGLSDAAMDRVSQIVQGHMVTGADGEEELDMMALPDNVCWDLHDLVSAELGAIPGAPRGGMQGPQVVLGPTHDEDTDED